MTTEDLALIDAEYQKVHGATQAVLMSQVIADVDAHQRALEVVVSAIESVETYWENVASQAKNKLNAAADKRKALVRDHDALKRRYWQLRRESDSLGQ